MAVVHAGKILYVNLSDSSVWTESLEDETIKSYLGSRGVNARLLWDKTDADVDPLGPENVLVFGAGGLSGTHAPCSGRTTVTCLSPATKKYFKANAGGYWGMHLKFAGYDHIAISGQAERPVYLFIDDDKVEVRDASHLWGQTVTSTNRTLKKEAGYHNLETAIIGPAGENKANIACIMLSTSAALARGGVGAVMGSKKLKAIAVHGTGRLKVADPERFHKVAMATRKALSEDSGAQGLYAFGTSGWVEGVAAFGCFPSFNFKTGTIKGIQKITGQNLVESGLLHSRIGCASCAISCHRFSVITTGAWAGTKTAGPEYETISSLGAGCGITDIEVIVKTAELCNEYGLDTISAGGVINWAMESYERGVFNLKDTDGIELNWGNGEAVIKLLDKIAHREGLGDLLAEGVKSASERTGKGSEAWAVQANGLEQSRVETRSAKGYALAFAVNPRGPDHLTNAAIMEFGLTEEARALVKKLTGDEKYANPYLTDKRAEMIRWGEDCMAVTDALGFCMFATTSAYGITPKDMADMFSSATGIEMGEDEIMFGGRRIITLERAINLRAGFDRRHDKLPKRMMNEPLTEGPQKGFVNSQEELDKMLEDYYQLHEWDVVTGRPTKQVLLKLGLADVAEELNSLGLLPSEKKANKEKV